MSVPSSVLLVGLLATCLASGCGSRPGGTTSVDSRPRPTSVDLLTDDRGQLREESWESHWLRGAKVGHRHTRIFELPATEPPQLRIVAVDRLEMKRFGNVTLQQLTTVSLETEEGQVLQWTYLLQSDDGPLAQTSGERVDGVIQDGRLELTRRGAGSSASHEYAWPEANHGFFAVERSLRRQPMKPGERRIVDAFLPLVDRATQTELRAVSWEDTRCGEAARRLLRIESADVHDSDVHDSEWDWGIPKLLWMDEAGQIWKSEESFLDRQTCRVSEAEARRPNDLVAWDIGLDAGVPVERKIEDPYATTQAVYRVQLEGLSPEKVFPDSVSQRLIVADDTSALLTVRQVRPDEPAELEFPDPGPEEEDRLPNRLIQSDDPRVIAIATAAAGSIDDPCAPRWLWNSISIACWAKSTSARFSAVPPKSPSVARGIAVSTRSCWRPPAALVTSPPGLRLACCTSPIHRTSCITCGPKSGSTTAGFRWTPPWVEVALV